MCISNAHPRQYAVWVSHGLRTPTLAWPQVDLLPLTAMPRSPHVRGAHSATFLSVDMPAALLGSSVGISKDCPSSGGYLAQGQPTFFFLEMGTCDIKTEAVTKES